MTTNTLFLVLLALVCHTSFAAIVTQPWYDAVEAEYTGSKPLKKCNKKKNVSPNDEQSCTTVKTCYFGTTDCSGTPYPTEECSCDGNTWDCQDVSCPAPAAEELVVEANPKGDDYTSFPSAAPTESP